MPETQYFEGIDVKSNGNTILSVDVIDTDARNELDDMANFIGYLSYLDGVSYKLNDVTPKIVNGRFFKNHNSSYGVVPVDNALSTVNIDYSKDWEVGIAYIFEGDPSQEEPIYGNTGGGWNSSPYILVGSPSGVNTAAVRVFDTSEGLWEIDPVIDTTVQENKWYFIKVAYNASTSTVIASTTSDFENWNTVTETRAGKTPKNTNQSAFASFKSGYTMNQYCVIDFANTYIKQNGLMIWGHFDGKFAGEHHYQNPAESWRPLNDGYSNFWFELTNDTLSSWLKFSAKTNNAVINWGDGSGEVALDTLTPTHTYSKPGRYIVKVKGVTGINRLVDTTDSLPYPLIYAELSNEVTALAGNSFYDCLQLKEVFIDNADYTYGCFMYCSALEKVYHGKSQSVLFGQLFQYCYSLKTVDINGITALNDNIFYACHSLEQITLPSTLTAIKNNVFNGSIRLREIHVEATAPPTLGTNVFNGLPSDYIIYVPVGYGATYKAASGWSTYADHIVEEGQTL